MHGGAESMAFWLSSTPRLVVMWSHLIWQMPDLMRWEQCVKIQDKVDLANFVPSSGDGPSKQDADVPPQLQDHRRRSARSPLLCRLWCQPPRSLKFKFLGQHHDVHHVRLFLESQLFRGFQQQRHGQVNLICNLQRWIICRCPIYCF